MELDSLTTFTRYTCCVAAKTISGASRMACDTQTTLELAPGDAPRNMNLKALNSTAIRIQWDPPLIPNGIIILYTVYINGNRRQKVNATGSTQSTAVGGFTPNKLLYVQLSASTSVGEGIKTGTERVTTLESVPGLVKNLRVVVKSEYILHVSWSPPTYTNGVLTGYTVVVTNLENPSDRILRRVAQNLHQLTIDRGIRPYVRYSVSVSASTRVGTGEPVEEIIYSQQGVPQSPPPNVTSSRTSATTANVKWDGIRWEDLRGWLVDYEIGYGSVMMSAYQKCRANGSYYTETMSVDSEGEYELTGLDPGLKYGVRLAGRTSAGAGPFSHTHVPWYINTIFTVTLEIENCTEWIAIKPAQLAEELAETFSTGIKLTCNCFFPSIYIADEQVMCHNKGLHLVFTGRIISTQVRDSSNLFEDLQMWLSRVLTVTVRDKELKIEKNESGSLIETNPGNECDEPPSDISHGSIIGGSVGGVLSVLLTVVVLIVAAVAVWQKHRSKSSVKCKPDSFLDDKTSRSAPLQKHISTELLSLGKQPPKTPPKPPPIKPLLPPQTPPKPAKKPLKPPKISPKPLKPPPRPLQVFPKHLITTPQPQKLPFKPIKIPLMPPKNRPTPQKDKQTKKFANKFRLPRQYELPVSQNHNVYKDPDIMEEKGGTTSLRNVAYEEAGSGTRAEKEEELYYPAIM
ncbi:Receptor-type tyrosine-protein phosphatase delta [Geodia barretti]|nr:Receptor-type tyrosine-protein phosphatase delta [Geodia barretti]